MPPSPGAMPGTGQTQILKYPAPCAKKGNSMGWWTYSKLERKLYIYSLWLGICWMSMEFGMCVPIFIALLFIIRYYDTIICNRMNQNGTYALSTNKFKILFFVIYKDQ